MNYPKNLLYNVTIRDPIYNIIRRNISYLLPEDLKELYDSSFHVQIIGTDSFFIHYSVSPLLLETHEDKLLESVLKYLHDYMSTQSYRKTKEKTVLDEELSIIYAVELTRVILELLNKKTKKAGEENGSKNNGEGKEGDKGKSNNDDNKKEDKEKPGSNSYTDGVDEEKNNERTQITNPDVNQDEMRKILTEATDKAEKMIEKAKAIRDIFNSSGASLETGDLKQVVDIANSILEVKDIEKIVTLAIETIKGLPKSFHFIKQEDPMGDEIRGYGKTRRLENALLRELALPDEILYYKLVSEGLLKREKEVSREGALYVVLDKSGSMSGYKMIWSRSIAIALYKMANIKKKEYYLRLFDTQVYPSKKPLTEKRRIIETLLTAPTNGGTRITHALETAIRDLETSKKEMNTDTIILITDGEDHVGIDEKRILKNNLQLITIMVGGENTTLKEISNIYYNAALTIDGALTLIKQTDKMLLTKLTKPFLKHA